MNYYGYVMPVVFLAAFGAYWFFMMNKRKSMMANMGPAMQSFFDRTGFRYADMPPEPASHHVQRAMQEAQTMAMGSRTTHYVRNFHGIPIHHVTSYQQTNNGYSMSCRWSADLQGRPRIPFHIADRSLSSVGKAIREVFSNVERVWAPRFPQPVTTGIPQLDQRMVVYGNDPAAVQWLFQNNPALVQSLLQCTEIDVWVDSREAVFADPFQKNMMAAMGGTVGSMAIGFDMGKRMDLSIPVHERISELLAMAVRASA